MRKLFLYFSIFIGLQAQAQTGNSVFNDTILHTIYIETALTDWIGTLDYDYAQNAASPELYPEIYRNCNVTFDGILFNNCGFREKGNASNSFTSYGKKKPLKISFDEFVNQELDGLEKINLSNFTNDPSLMHDATCYKIMRDEGIPAPRTSYAKVFVNNEYIGLYLIIENVDKTFLKFEYGSANNDGNLYKTDRGVSVFLNWLGPDKAAYKEQGLKLNTNESVDDWTKLIDFINLLNNYAGGDIKQQIENNFDVHAYLKILAIEKCVRSWDSYWGGGNNFYMYEHPDGKIRWIPWDMNETFQDLKVLSGTSMLDGYLVPNNKVDERPLLKRIFEVPEWKEEYLNYCCELIKSSFTMEHLGPFLVDRHELIDEAYRTDVYKYNSYAEFKKSLTDYNEDEVSITTSAYVLRLNYPGIFPFIQSQREWVVKQQEGWGKECSIADNGIYNLFVFPNPTNDYIHINNEPNSFEYAQFQIYNSTGKLYRQTKFDVMSGSSYKLDLTGIPQGFYMLLKISADGRIGRAKVVVK
ncbi:MAG: CotH kinase family protein [Bacteroidetes bacterium]|nr:CotH kinase family protein [Bacteroidota bacterium]